MNDRWVNRIPRVAIGDSPPLKSLRGTARPDAPTIRIVLRHGEVLTGTIPGIGRDFSGR